MRISERQLRNNQQGAVLIISLLMLLMLTLIGVSSMQTTIMEERMAGNMRDQSIAFQSAEAAVREAEQYIEAQTTTGNFGNQNGLFADPANEPDPWDAATWTTAAKYRSATAPHGSDSAKYFITQLKEIKNPTGEMSMTGYSDNKGGGDISAFRVIARGTGASNDSAEVLIRSHYGRRF